MLQITEVDTLVKIEGTLDEIRELMGDARDSVRAVKSATKKVVKTTTKTKRKLSAWQRYLKNPRNQIKFKTGTKKGRLNLKAMARAFKKTKK